MPEKIVLAYSGGLDTTVAVRWLAQTRGFEVIALTVDLGSQPKLEVIRERALTAGAAPAYPLGGPPPLLGRVFWPAPQAGAPHQSQYPPRAPRGRSLRPRVSVV